MCQQHEDHDSANRPVEAAESDGSPFPWSLGVYDAHCHPTDVMKSFDTIPNMKATTLTVMATRSQDQDLVANAAASPLAINSKDHFNSTEARKEGIDSGIGRIVPSFGWHPWFSHQLYDDSLPEAERTYQPSKHEDLQAAKQAHYSAALQPSPKAENQAFLDSLPEPTSLSSYISTVRARLQEHPLALVGEIGLDKAFRLPEAFNEETLASRDESLTPGGRDGRLLSPHRVRMAHQVAVLKAQLALAGETGRPVSVHGVQAHGVLHDTLASCWKGHEKEVLSRRERRRIAPGAEDFSSSDEDEDDDDDYGLGGSAGKQETSKDKAKTAGPKPYPPRICLHSFSGPDEMLKQYLNPAIPAQMFFSFSLAVNMATADSVQKSEEVIKMCPDDRILIESDLHVAGDQMDEALEGMYRKVCRIKGWELEEGIKRIRKNYEQFIFG